MSISISRTAGNLLNIAHTVQRNPQVDEKDLKAKLVPSLWGGALYEVGDEWYETLWAKWLVLFYSIMAHLGKEMRSVRFEVALLKTERAFSDYLIHVQQNLNDDQIVIDWSNWMLPVLKRDVFPNIQKIDDLFKKKNEINEESSHSINWALAYTIFEEVSNQLKVWKCESILSHPFPDDIILKKIVEGTCLDVKESIQLKAWMEAVDAPFYSFISKWNFLQRKITVRQLHKALAVKVNRAFAKEGIPKGQKKEELLILCEYALTRFSQEYLKRDFEIFKQPDPKHLKWRYRVAENKKISVGSSLSEFSELICGDLMGSRKGDLKDFYKVDNHLVLLLNQKIKEQEAVLVIGLNQALLGIELCQRKVLEKALNITPNSLFVDQMGLFRIDEKLLLPFKDVKWTTKQGEKLTENDQKIATIFINFLHKVMEQKFVSKNFKLENLFLDEKSQSIKMTQNITQDTFDFFILEKIVNEIGNRYVHRFIMSDKSIHAHLHVKVMRSVAENYLGSQKKELKVLFEESNVDDFSFMEHAYELQKQLENVKSKCLKKTTENGYYTKEETEKVIEDILLKQYQADRSAFLLIDTFEDDVKKQTEQWIEIKKAKLALKGIFD